MENTLSSIRIALYLYYCAVALLFMLAGCAPAKTSDAKTPIDCNITNHDLPLGVACTGANAGQAVVDLDLKTMFALSATQKILTVGLAFADHQPCVSVNIFDSSTQTTTENHTQCGTTINLQTRSLE